MKNMSTWTKAAFVGGLACGIGEVLLAPTLGGVANAAFALLFAVIFFAGCAWLWRGNARGAIVIAIFATIELAFMPAYDWSGPANWIPNGLYAAASTLALVASVGALVERRRRRPAPARSAA